MTASQTQKYKLSVVSEGEAAAVWREVVGQVPAVGLMVGVRASMPRRTAAAMRRGDAVCV